MRAATMSRNVRWVCGVAIVAATMLLLGAHSAETGPATAAVDDGAVAPAQAAPTVFSGHPRLIVGGYRGVTVPELKAACAHADMRGECDRIGGRHMLDDAMRYLLVDDAAAAGRVRNKLLAGLSCSDGYEHSAAGGYALAYDWVWDALSPSDRTRVEGTLADCGTGIVRSLRGNGPHLWHGFTSQASALALVSLALDEHPERATLRADAAELFRERSLEAYEVTGGAWPEGYSYMRTHFFSSDPPYQYVVDALRAWDSAVVQDHPDHASLFETISEEEGDWLRGLGYHVLYGTVSGYPTAPQFSLLRGGDMPTGQAHPNKQYRPFVDAIARIYHEPLLKQWGEMLENDWSFVGGSGTYHPIHRYGLPYNLPVGVPDVDPAPEGRVPEWQPRARLWSRDDLGYVISRWGTSLDEVDAPIVTYRAGSWFTGHQHMDQGHFDIWHHGPLALDSGVYARWGSEHREGYYARAIAHNTVLIHQPGEKFEQHPGFGDPVNDDGQRIHTHNKRGCAQCMQSVEEWRSNIGEGMHFEAGRIEAFEESYWAAVVRSDITGAYNSTRYSTPGNTAKVELVQRDLTYVGLSSSASALIVADRVRTMPGAELPRFTVHVPAKPVMDDLKVVVGTSDDGILTSSSQRFRVSNGTGVMQGHTVLPADTRTTLVGGVDHRYWVDGANRDGGASGLEGAPAEPGLWRIEVEPATSPNPDDPTDTLLVQVLIIGDESLPEITIDAVLMDSDPIAPAPALVLNGMGTDQSLVFSGAVPRSPIQFASLRLAGPIQFGSRLILTDLVPGARYRIVTYADSERVIRDDEAASPEGVINQLITGVDAIVFGICPVPEGAGEEWQRLCDDGAANTPSPTSPVVTPGASPTTPMAPTPTSGILTARCYLPLTEAAQAASP